LFEFPNMKECYIPDPGYTMFEIDLAGADAQVVAWTARNEPQKDAFRKGIKIHVHNGTNVFGRDKMFSRDAKGKSEPYYTQAKKGAHATNYGATDAAERCGMTQDEWRTFQRDYFRANPPIKDWHERVEHEVQTTRKVKNRFGFDVTYYDRPASVFNEALAWEPSSTVSEVTYIAMEKLEQNALIELLLQVHDSLLGQIPTRHLRPALTWMYHELHEIVIPFPDPLIIPWGLKLSEQSWGHMEEVKWDDYLIKPEKVQELVSSL
jgi:DNA polymerase I-like protein with 3'-5' exonuclease and polymerase domains